MKKYLFYILCLLLLASCFALPVEEPVLPPPTLHAPGTASFRTIEVRRGDVIRQIDIPANYVPAQEESLGFEIGDEYIHAIHVEIGDFVRQGDIIAELDRTYYLNELEKIERDEAWARLELSQLEEQHELRLAETRLNDEQVDETRYMDQKNAIQTRLETLRIRKEYLLFEDSRRVLISGLSGMVTAAPPFQEGMQSTAGRLVFTIADQTQSVFMVRGPDTERMTIGQRYDITINWEPYTAVVVDAGELGIFRTSDQETYLMLADDEPPIVGTRVFATVHLILAEARDVLYVPSTAVRKANNRIFVYVMEDGVRGIRDIEIGLEGNTLTEVVSGLTEGEVISQE
jgi:macrolide-specific efflux system membrane fusion protein